MTDTRWLTEDEDAAWRSYLRATRSVNVALDRDLQPFGISFSEYELLSVASEAAGGRIRMSVLADAVVQSRSRVTHTSARLERRGWVRREPAPDDGRGVLLTVTKEGRALLDKIAPLHVASVRRHLLDSLTRDQLDALRSVMATIRDHMDANPEATSQR